MQPTWHEPSKTPEGELLLLVKEMESMVLKNVSCMNCSDPDCCPPATDDAGSFKPNRGDEELPKLPKSKKQSHTKEKKSKKKDKGEGDKMYSMAKASMDEKNKYCQKHFGRNYSECTSKQKAQCDENCGAMNRGEGDKMYSMDKTSEFLASKGIMVKYEVEPTESKSGMVPVFMDHGGGTPVEASGYGTNQVVPEFANTQAPKSKFIHEKAQIYSAAQTGYDEKGSTLHMKLNDGGNRADGNWNMAPIEERLTQLKKSGYGNPGLLEEIAHLTEQIAGRLQ